MTQIMKIKSESDEMDDEVFVNIRNSTVLPSSPKPPSQIDIPTTDESSRIFLTFLLRNLTIDLLKRGDLTLNTDREKKMINTLEELCADIIGIQYANITADAHQPDLANITLKKYAINTSK